MATTLSTRRLPPGRAQLVEVLARGGDVIQIADVMAALAVPRTQAAKRLSSWTHQGWLRRVGRGAYVPAALETLGDERVLDDAWVLVPALFAPAYVGGRTAAEHWDLTEQIFNDVVVLTVRTLRETRQERHGVPFTLKHINAAKIFGTKSVWRRHTKVLVSDVHRTIVDMLDDPALGGGIQHVADCLNVYLARTDRSDETLIAYADRLGNGAVFKRLGFLAERHPEGAPLASRCASHLTTGNALLDPAMPGPRLVTRWHLRIPHSWAKELQHDRQA
jgi:predicted transcriptional regulator of viral defense system